MKRYTAKFLFGMVLALTIVLSGFSISSAIDTTVEKIVADKDSYDGKEVSVTGKVSNLKFRTANVERNFTTFMLVGESGGHINVFVLGSLKLDPGQKVQVTGVYRKVRITIHRTYYNEIEASEVK
jgi:hypothetical protein